MADRSFTSDLAALPDSGEALRIIIGWEPKNTEAVEFAAWLGRSLPVEVQVVSTVDTKWKKPLSAKKHSKWLKDKAPNSNSRRKKL